MNEESMSMGKRFLGVLYAPQQTFKSIGEDPRIMIPALLVIALSAVLTVLIIPETQEVTRLLLQKDPKATADLIETSVRWTGISAILGIVLGMPLLWLIQAGLLSLYNQLSIGQATFKQLFAVSVFSSVPSVIGTMISVGLVKAMGAKSLLSVKTSLGLLLPPGQDSGLLFNFLNSLNLFTIWALILLSIGGGIVMQKEGKKVGIYLFTLWLVFILALSIVNTRFGTGAPSL